MAEGAIVICMPDTRFRFRGIDYCYVCKTDRRVVGHCEAWYGDTVTCCHCGTTYHDDYPNKPAKTKQAAAIAKAKAKWNEIGPGRSRHKAIGEMMADWFDDEEQE